MQTNTNLNKLAVIQDSPTQKIFNAQMKIGYNKKLSGKIKLYVSEKLLSLRKLKLH